MAIVCDKCGAKIDREATYYGQQVIEGVRIELKTLGDICEQCAQKISDTISRQLKETK